MNDGITEWKSLDEKGRRVPVIRSASESWTLYLAIFLNRNNVKFRQYIETKYNYIRKVNYLVHMILKKRYYFATI